MNKIFTLVGLVFLSNFLLAQPYTIGHTTITFNDPNRTGGFGSGGGSGRQMQTEIYYPGVSEGEDVAVASGEFPVIIFGHGFVMTWDSYNNIWEEFVPQGYVMAFLRTEGSISPNHEDFGLDLRQVAEKMQELNANSGSLFYQALTNKTAIMGHSMGGGSSVLASANNVDIATYVGLAPAETNPSAVSAAANVSVPSLIFSGSSDGVTPPQDHHIPIYEALGSSCKYFVNILDGSHCYFASSSFTCDFGETSPGSLARLEQQDIMNDLLTLWFNYTLRDNVSASTVFNDSISVSQRVTYQENCVVSTAKSIEKENVSVFTKNEVLHFLLPFSEGQAIVEIYDINVRLITFDKILLSEGRGELPLTALNSGVYVARLCVGNRYFSKKFIVR